MMGNVIVHWPLLDHVNVGLWMSVLGVVHLTLLRVLVHIIVLRGAGAKLSANGG